MTRMRADIDRMIGRERGIMDDLTHAVWRKSSRSGSGNECVEVAQLADPRPRQLPGHRGRPPTWPEGQEKVRSLLQIPGQRRAGWTTLSRVTIPEKLPHKISQMRHDLDDLYELVSRVEQNLVSRVEQVEQNQTRTIGILQRHNNRFEELQQTLDLQGGRLDLQGGRLDRIEDNQRRQFDQLSAQLAEILGALRGPAAADPAADSER